MNPRVVSPTHMGAGSYEFFAAHAAASIAAGQSELALETYGNTSRSRGRREGGGGAQRGRLNRRRRQAQRKPVPG